MSKSLNEKYLRIKNEFYKLYRTRKEKYNDSIKFIEPMTKPSCWQMFCYARLKETDVMKEIFQRFDSNEATEENVKNLEFLLNKFRSLR